MVVDTSGFTMDNSKYNVVVISLSDGRLLKTDNTLVVIKVEGVLTVEDKV